MKKYDKTQLVNGLTLVDALKEFEAANYKGTLLRLSQRGVEKFSLNQDNILVSYGNNNATEFSTHHLNPAEKSWAFQPEKVRLIEVFQYHIQNSTVFSVNKLSIVTKDWFEYDDKAFEDYLKSDGRFLVSNVMLVAEGETFKVSPIRTTIQFVMVR